MKCAFSRFSSSGTPHPIVVSHRMTDGAPVGLACSATASNADSSASTLLPSTRWVNHPQAAHLSVIGSMRSTPAVGPSACSALMSTMAVKFPSR